MHESTHVCTHTVWHEQRWFAASALVHVVCHERAVPAACLSRLVLPAVMERQIPRAVRVAAAFLITCKCSAADQAVSVSERLSWCRRRLCALKAAVPLVFELHCCGGGRPHRHPTCCTSASASSLLSVTLPCMKGARMISRGSLDRCCTHRMYAA